MNDKREYLIDKATAFFATHGIVGVTVDELSKASGMSKKTVYQYFANKETIVETVVIHAIEQFKSIIRLNIDTSVDPVEELIFQRDLFKQMIDLRYLFNDFALKRYPKALREFKKFKTDYLKDVIETNFKCGLEKGLYQGDLDFKSTATIYISVINFIVFDSSRSHDDILAVLHLFIKGIATSDGRRLFANYLK